MAKAGLSFESSMFDAMNLNASPNPYDATTNIGLGNLDSMRTDMAVMQQAIERDSQFTMPDLSRPAAPDGPQVMYSPSTNKMFVNGALFDADDSTSALQSRDFLTAQPTMAPNTASDWQTVSPQAYAKYIRNIENPSTGTLMARNFEIGGSNLKLLAGRGMQFLGAEETGQDWVNEAVRELYYNQPFQREFTEIDVGSESNGVIDWFVANLAQQGPNLIESLATGLVGAGAGAVAGGGANPFTAVGGAFAALAGKSAFKQAVLAAAKKYAQGQALTVGERKLLREVSGLSAASLVRRGQNMLPGPGVGTLGQINRQIVREGIDTGAGIALRGGRNQAMLGGAALGNLAGSYAMGVADVYGEMRDTGQDNRALAALAGIPYAALESMPEFILGLRMFGVSPASVLTRGGMLRRGATGFAVGGTLEGATEVGQEALLLSTTDQFDLSDGEVVKRLINSFAAGFAVGGPLGAGANMLRANEPTNLLDDTNKPEPSSALVPFNPNNPSPNPLNGEVLGPELPPAPGGLPSPAQAAALPAPTPPVTPVGTPPNFVAGMGSDATVRAGTPLDTLVQVDPNAAAIPPQFAGQQGVLNVFGNEPLSNQELAARMDGQPAVPQALAGQQVVPPVADPNQLQLPLEDPTVSAVRSAQIPAGQQTLMTQRLQEAANIKDAALRKENELAMREAELARQEAQMERERAERQRQFDQAVQQRQAQQIAELEAARVNQILAENDAAMRLEAPALPTRPVPVRAPQQLPLFPRSELPPASYPNKLARRRAEARQAAEQEAAQAPMTAAEARAAGQGILFTQQGEVSKAADQGVAPAATPAPAQTKLKKGKSQGAKDAVQERSATQVDVREQPEAGREVPVGDAGEQQATRATRGQERLRKAKASTPAVQQTEVAADQQGQEVDNQQAAQEQQQDQVTPTYDSPIEAWAETAPVEAVAYDRLTASQKEKYAKAVADNRVDKEFTQKFYDAARSDLILTEMEELDEAVIYLSKRDEPSFHTYGAAFLVEMAFFGDNVQPKVRAKAIATISDIRLPVDKRRALEDAFLEQVNAQESIAATAGGKKRAWFTFAQEAMLLDRVEAEITAPPKGYAPTVAQEAQGVVNEVDATLSTEEDVAAKKRRKASEKVAAMIEAQMKDAPPTKILKPEQSRIVKDLEAAFADADPKYLMARGVAVGDFFTATGKLKLYKQASGRYIPTTKEMSATETAARQTEERQATAALRASERKEKADAAADSQRKSRLDSAVSSMTEDEMYDSWDSSQGGLFYRADNNGTANNPLPLLKIQAAIKKALRGLKLKPTVSVYKNVEDLRTRNPALFKRAAAGRPAGEFEKTAAVGYSIGDQVIIFSDYARTEKQVAFVVAHETLGHFGFRAFLPMERLRIEFKKIYNSDGNVRAIADRNMASGMKFDEAVEEAIADQAAVLDTSMIAKLWAMLKNALNAFGVTFEDDAARYLIGRARKNLRSGGNMVGAKQLKKNLDAMYASIPQGRYSLEGDRADLGRAFFAMHGLNKKNGMFSGLDGFKEYAQKVGAARTAGDFGSVVGQLLETVQTLDNKATRSEGLSLVFQIFQNATARTRRFLSTYENLTKFSHSTRANGTLQEQAGELLAYGALFKASQFSESDARKLGSLAIVGADGTVVIDPRVFQQLKDIGTITREQFQNGIRYTDAAGNVNTWKPAFQITDDIWRIYSEQREAVNQSALDVLESQLGSIIEQRAEAIANFKKIKGRNGTMTSLEIQTLNRVIEEYQNLYYANAEEVDGRVRLNNESVEQANTFLAAINRVMHTPAKLQDWKTGADNTAAFQGAQYRDIIDGLERLADLGVSEANAYKITNTIQSLNLLQANTQAAEMRAKQTIMSSYVPFPRRGTHQVMVKAYDKNGNAVELNETYKGMMPYFRDDQAAVADEIAFDINTTLGDTEFTVMNSMDEEVTVTFRAERSKARQSKPVTSDINLAQVTNLLTRLGVNITPQARKRIITELTDQDSKIRRRLLQRTGVGGWDKDVVRSVSEYLETQAHVAGKTYYAHRLNNIMLDNDKWLGDAAQLKNLAAEAAEAKDLYRQGKVSQETVRQAEQAYAKYAHMYRYSAPKGAQTKATVNGKSVDNEGRGEDYREEAKKLIRWYSESSNIADSTEDILSGETGSKLKLLAVLLQLGGNLATAAINAVSMVTHSVPYLSTYNTKNGFGGGFGMTKSAAAMARASRHMANPKLAESAHLQEVVNSPELQRKYGLTQDEAEFLRDATYEGVLQAAQFNALLGTSRGGVRSNKSAKAIQVWMSAFSYTEQLNRRTTALAAYRLEKARATAAFNGQLTGQQMSDVQDRASTFARNAVNTSQGEYNMYNRPEMARGNFLQYVFMYKQFVIISVQLMKNLAPKERVAFLGMIFLSAGLKGLPFGDDIMDLLDTLAQRFGIPISSVEKYVAELADEMIPGAGVLVTRGLLDYATGMTFSSRLGFGDLIPMSGVLKKGLTADDYIREAEGFLGPVWGGVQGMVATGWHAAEWGAAALGLGTQTTSLMSVMRESPIAAVRNITDGLTYLSSGDITNKQGKLVLRDATTAEGIARMVGFYPSRATYSTDVIRMSRQARNYTTAIKSEFTAAYVRAMLERDTAGARALLRDIAEWNRDWRGTEFEMRNFQVGANRALQAARIPAASRYAKFAPTNIRPEVQLLQEIYGIED